MGVFDWKHWLVVLIVAVLLFGSKRLKHLGADLGESIKGFRRSVNSEDDVPAPAVASVRVEGEAREAQHAAREEHPGNR